MSTLYRLTRSLTMIGGAPGSGVELPVGTLLKLSVDDSNPRPWVIIELNGSPIISFASEAQRAVWLVAHAAVER